MMRSMLRSFGFFLAAAVCLQAAPAKADLQDLLNARADKIVERHGIDPRTASTDELRLQVARMKKQLEVDCQPILQNMRGLLEAASLYREQVLFIQKRYAEARRVFADARAKFAIPPDNVGSDIPKESESKLKGNAFYNVEVRKIVTRAKDAGVIKISKGAPGVDLALIAMAPPEIRRDFLFFSGDSKEEEEKRQLIRDLGVEFNKLKAKWKIDRTKYIRAFGPVLVEQLNGEFDFYNEQLRDIADGYTKGAVALGDLARTNRFEHCVGKIVEQVAQSVVVGQLQPFFQPGPIGSVDALPGMGYNLAFRPETKPFEFVSIPEDFPYVLNFKNSFRGSRELALVEMIGAIEAQRAARRDSAFYSDLLGLKNTIVGDIERALFATVGEGAIKVFTGIADMAQALTDPQFYKDMDRLAGRLILDQEFSGQLADAALQGLQDRYVALRDALSNDINMSLDREKGESDEAYFERLRQITDIEAKIELVTDTASDVVAIVFEVATGEAFAAAGKFGVKSLKGALVGGRQVLRQAGSKLDDVARKLAQKVDGGVPDKATKKLIDDIDFQQRKLDDLADKNNVLERRAQNVEERFGDLSNDPNKKPKFDPNPTDKNGDPLPDAELKLKDKDGNDVEIKDLKLLAEGGSSRAFLDPDNPDIIIRETSLDEFATKKNNPAAAHSDEIGRNIIEELKRDGKLPDARMVRRDSVEKFASGEEFSSQQIIVERVERLPGTAADIIEKQGSVLTKGQKAARDNFMNALNDGGFVWPDNTTKNFSFLNKGGDNWELVVLDPGGIVPATDPTAAKKAQKFLDGLTDGSFSAEEAVQVRDSIEIFSDLSRAELDKLSPKQLSDEVKKLAVEKKDAFVNPAIAVQKGILDAAIDKDKLANRLADLAGDPNLPDFDLSDAVDSGALELFGPLKVQRGSEAAFGDGFDLEKRLDDLAAEAESIVDRQKAEAARAQQLADEANKNLNKSPAGGGGGVGATVVGGAEAGKRLLDAAKGDLNNELKAQGNIDQVDPIALAALKDLGRSVMSDFRDVDCAELVNRIVGTEKNDNAPDEGLQGIDQDKVDACAGGKK